MKNNPRIVDEKCKKCGHHQGWVQRGNLDPQYVYKCSKCGYKE